MYTDHDGYVSNHTLLFCSYLPNKEAEQTEKGVHEADVMADAGDDGLLAVWTHGLHWS